VIMVRASRRRLGVFLDHEPEDFGLRRLCIDRNVLVRKDRVE
jgi:hypothetical protein